MARSARYLRHSMVPASSKDGEVANIWTLLRAVVRTAREDALEDLVRQAGCPCKRGSLAAHRSSRRTPNWKQEGTSALRRALGRKSRWEHLGACAHPP